MRCVQIGVALVAALQPGCGASDFQPSQVDSEPGGSATVIQGVPGGAAAEGRQAGGAAAEGGQAGGAAAEGGQAGGTAAEGGQAGSTAAEGGQAGGTAAEGGQAGGASGAPPTAGPGGAGGCQLTWDDVPPDYPDSAYRVESLESFCQTGCPTSVQEAMDLLMSYCGYGASVYLDTGCGYQHLIESWVLAAGGYIFDEASGELVGAWSAGDTYTPCDPGVTYAGVMPNACFDGPYGAAGASAGSDRDLCGVSGAGGQP